MLPCVCVCVRVSHEQVRIIIRIVRTQASEVVITRNPCVCRSVHNMMNLFNDDLCPEWHIVCECVRVKSTVFGCEKAIENE